VSRTSLTIEEVLAVLTSTPQRIAALTAGRRQRGYVGDLAAMSGPSMMCSLISVS